MSEQSEVMEHIERGERMVLGVMLRALLATHPEPQKLRAVIDAYLDNAREFMREEGWGPLATEMFGKMATGYVEQVGLLSE